jgi:aryl-alcohol dehydrogenase-like predicted oxidoreductase
MLEGSHERMQQGLALLVELFDRGGTAIYTAVVYGSEPIVGHWIATRGVRDEICLIGKGAHTPHCTPEYLTSQLLESLDKLQTDHVDIYMMHRDNLDVPAADFVETLNEHVRAGRIHAFGGSNWSLGRVAEANAYAKEKGLQGFQCVSNNFSLARMVDPIWKGGISSSDAESRQWLQAHNVSLFAWSSQARGFFARGDKNFTDDAELVRCWYSDDNFQRLERAEELAAKKGVSPVVIAAVYVLAQPFQIYAIIGPRTMAETLDSMQAFAVELTADEVKWLNLEG